MLEPALGFDDIETIATATLQGAGLAHMPLWRVRSALDSGALVRLLPEVPAARIPLHVLWPRTRFLPYRLRVTIDALLAAIPPLLQEQS